MELSLRRHKGFYGGAVLPDDKDQTECLAIEDIPAGAIVQLPLDDGAGGIAEAKVRPGEKVVRGQCIACPQTDGGVRMHSSVSGVVRQIEQIILPDGTPKPAVIIDSDSQDEKDLPTQKDQWKLYSEGLINCLSWAGITQMGPNGGSLINNIRQAVKAGLRWVIINAVESEPLITAETRLMTEYAEQISRGCQLLAEIFGLASPGRKSSGPRGLLALCGVRHQALRAMRHALKGGSFRLAVLADVYPQDEEVLLANTLARAHLRSTSSPAQAGILIINLSSLWALSRAWYDSEPLTDRIITISGDGTERIGNYRVRIGSQVADVIKHVEPLPEASRFILGGPLRGWGRTKPQGVVTKQTAGLTVLTEAFKPAPEACIRCGWCSNDCPVQIDPVGLYRMIEAGRVEQAQKAWLDVCIECGLCSYVCPTHLPLLAKIRAGKWALKYGSPNGD